MLRTTGHIARQANALSHRTPRWGLQARDKSGAAAEPLAAAFARRLAIWEEEWEKYVHSRSAVGTGPGTVLYEGHEVAVTLGVTRPADVMAELDVREEAGAAVAALLDGSDVWELSRPLERSCRIQFLSIGDPRGRSVFWHSAAHLLGLALETEYGERAMLCDGPALAENGFFYELFLADGSHVSPDHFKGIKRAMQRAAKRKDPFLRMPVSREVAQRMFEDNPFKLDMLRAIPADQEVTVYRSGPFVDLCRGPHVPHTGVFGGVDLLNCGSSHWTAPGGSAVRGGGHGAHLDAEGRALLQRVYGVAFPSAAELKEWKQLREEAQRRDHRVVGKALRLWHFDAHAPGSPFVLPHGVRIFNRLVSWLREEYERRGYQEVMTPQLFRTDLWRTSGHLQNYAENMYMARPGSAADALEQGAAAAALEGGQGADESHTERFGVKPMNCPAHCLVFEALRPTARELPLRIADFSPLHRNELAGTLTGLTRVRRFHQDDGHIFCTREQVPAEIEGVLDFIHDVYSTLGFSYSLRLSTRPEKYMGDVAVWDDAERALQAALEAHASRSAQEGSAVAWELNPGDGAFYGPKIDITVRDALKREHQCATVQLDFLMPERFDLSYTAPGGETKRPVMIHRAILGSVERMLAVFTEHYGGRFPFWLSPRQVQIVPVSDADAAFAEETCERLRRLGFFADCDTSPRSMNKKIREAQVHQYNYICVVGPEERAAGGVNVRKRTGDTLGIISVEGLEELLTEQRASRAVDA